MWKEVLILFSNCRDDVINFLLNLNHGLSKNLYGDNVRPVSPFGSTYSKPVVDSLLIHRCLPDELLFEIFGRITPYNLGKTACVCRKWRNNVRNLVF
ncbi:hypothetical protein L1987_24149 [Smallanthus sonchifolius]|uniref:Uncharacterized protein n=1 Tax=Smallanthus sonchifolius TaxID=185202 RepID=A0ACB9IL49_9ASTR|nr:hypothetical protein L1987_24149 [Smallanthus sonchifolius]